MINYRQKEYTIQEGHYSGTKSIKRVPGAFKVIAKSILAGLGIGAGVGVLMEDTTVGEGAKKGVKTGFWAGVALKILIDKFHKPMSSVKFQKVDKAIRKEYGIKEVSGMIIGDTKERRDDLNSHFAFNDNNILGFKINVSIQKNKVTLYTRAFEKKDLELLDESLNYFCFKYHGMEYSSKLINERDYSYSITITFTNYEAIAKFLVEISNSLNTRINILDDKATIEKNLKSEEKTFSLLRKESSLPSFDKYDMMKILGTGGTIVTKSGFKTSLGDYAMDIIMAAISRAGDNVKSSRTPFGVKVERRVFGNAYLEEALQKMRYRENLDYTVGKNNSSFNLYLNQGHLFICSALGGRDERKLENIVEKYGLIKTIVKNQATIYSYKMVSRDELNLLLRDLMNLSLKPNIYTK